MARRPHDVVGQRLIGQNGGAAGITPLHGEAGRAQGGLETRPQPQSAETAPLLGGWRPTLAVAGVVCLLGFGLVRRSYLDAAPRRRRREPGGRRASQGRPTVLVASS